jgi:hypothetical protein
LYPLKKLFISFHLANSTGKSLLGLVEGYEDTNVFLEEVPFGSDAISAELLNRLSETISENLYLWIACRANESQDTSELKGSEVLIKICI